MAGKFARSARYGVLVAAVAASLAQPTAATAAPGDTATTGESFSQGVVAAEHSSSASADAATGDVAVFAEVRPAPLNALDGATVPPNIQASQTASAAIHRVFVAPPGGRYQVEATFTDIQWTATGRKKLPVPVVGPYVSSMGLIQLGAGWSFRDGHMSSGDAPTTTSAVVTQYPGTELVIPYGNTRNVIGSARLFAWATESDQTVASARATATVSDIRLVRVGD